ncbi:ABC transporter substrate-binding protein [Bacillus sp. J14TS2]|uniref:extracellular solute-binding protein n=1 Tax=Bacillus sp. J14TS2 TaxID=2807188 RepID=UPI001B252D39|nr:extracellular solute-binding protein [Bacillus sp. J14TS2]GIN72393.1 ABC transporter substrate-binding protein [Bacillus sp. J14TS2]
MRFKKIQVITILLAVLLFLSACNKQKAEVEGSEVEDLSLDILTESGLPIVEEPITLNMFVKRRAAAAEDWNDVLVFNKYEELSNIDVKWEMTPQDGLEEKRNLLLSSGGKLPDALHSAEIPNIDILKYGEQGTFIRLNDLIEEHAPNLTKLFEENPEIKKGLTFPDGNIYSFPLIASEDFTSYRIGARPWFKRDWLEVLDMDVPETLDEFYQYLKVVKETDLLGDGSNREIPFGANSMDHLVNWLKGSFGLGNRGTAHPYIDMDPEEEKLRFIPTSPEYKEMLEYINKLYSENLIEQNIFTIEHNNYLANGSEGLYGTTIYWSTESAFGVGEDDYDSGIALEGPDGDQLYSNVYPTLSGIQGFVITKDNQYPAATVRWIDHFFSDEGAKLYYLGVEGETYEQTADGEYTFLDEITNNPDGLTLSQAISKYLTYPNGGAPGIIIEEFYQGTETLPALVEAADKNEPFLIQETWPAFTFTSEESKKMASLTVDIEKYVEEMRDKFISGNVSFSEWDKYVKTIENMRLSEYMETQEEAYKRFKNS